MVNKDFCLSSYIAYRYIYKDDMEFFEGMKHELYKALPLEERIKVTTADDIDSKTI